MQHGSHLAIDALRNLTLGGIRARLKQWGVAPSIADEAEPRSIVWAPALYGTAVPAGVLQSGNLWIIIVPRSRPDVVGTPTLAGALVFEVKFRRSEPPNERACEWVA